MDRSQKIFERMEKYQTGPYWIDQDGVAIDLFAEDSFAQKSFMARKARFIEATVDSLKVITFPDELLSGSFLGAWKTVIHTTFEERCEYCDMNMAFPRRNNEWRDGKNVYSSKPLRLSREDLKSIYVPTWGWGHSCGGFKRILEMGYEGIANDAQKRIDEMKASGCVDNDKIDFWEAVITCVNAVCRLSDRYAQELYKQAEEADEKRANELIQMAKNMENVPKRPAATFWEALQSIWFTYMVGGRFNGTDIGRLDQYVYPYYKRDIDEGRITEEFAQELIDGFMLKCYELYVAVRRNAGLHPSIMLGGLNADGKDGTNDITIMCLKSKERFPTPTPKLSVRLNEFTPNEIYEISHRMLMKGINQPDFYADRVVIPAYERIGVPFEDAVEYAQSVCEEVSLAGISEDCTNEGPHCDMHDKVWLAMLRVANGEDAPTFDDFMKIVEDEIRKCILDEMEFHNLQTYKLAKISPQPLHSAGIIGCLESGKDITQGGAKYNNTGSVVGGIATASDSLYSIKKLVYDDKRLTMKEFCNILVENYEGHELLRLEILNKFPKYGNDDDRVDIYATQLFDIFADELEKHTNSRGGVYKVGAWASEYRSSYMATPDGRRQGDTFATNISPTPGKDIKGVTAVIKSGTKVNMKICTAGAMLDVAINPSCLRGEGGVQRLKQILSAYEKLGGSGIQFNIIDAKMLEDAKANPEKYSNLMVRVWGYNDYFVSLDNEKQEHIISRTIHGEM